MQLTLNLEKESIQDLEKAIKILTKVKENKEQNKPTTDGLDEIISIPKAPPQQGHLSAAAQKALEQEKMMKDIDLSKIFGG